MGNGALANNVSVSNTAVGFQALVNATNNNNTALGYSAGHDQTTGSNNIYIGAEEPGVPGENNTIRIGDNLPQVHNESACYIGGIYDQGFNMEKQATTIAKQQKQIDALTVGLQKVSAQLEASKPAPHSSTIPKKGYFTISRHASPRGGFLFRAR